MPVTNLKEGVLLKASTKQENESFIFANVCSLRKHHVNLQNEINNSDLSPLVCALQEIWLPSAAQEVLEGYKNLVSITRSKSNPNAGGGVGMFIREDVKYTVIDTNYEPKTFETQAILIEAKKLVIINIYNPPTNNNRIFLSKLTKLIDEIKDKYKKPKIICGGDFNINMLKESPDKTDFQNAIIDMGLIPNIKDPTRLGKQSTLIDNILSNFLVKDSGTLPWSIADHLPAFITVNSKKKISPGPNKKTRDLSGKAVNNLLNLLEKTDWSSVTKDNTEGCFITFHEMIKEALDITCPLKEKKQKSNKKYQKIEEWMTNGLLTSRRHKIKLHKKLNKDKTKDAITKRYKTYSKVYAKCIKKAKTLHIQEQLSLNQNNPRKTWEIINNITGRGSTKDQLPDTFINDGRAVTKEKNIAEGFNSFFTNVGPSLARLINVKDPNHFKTYLTRTKSKLAFKSINIQELDKIMSNIKPKKSKGHDDISNCLLKQMYPRIKPVILHLMNTSIILGHCPEHWKVAKVIPIYKNGNPQEYNNYRPISLLPTISKVIEKIIAKQTLDYLSENNLLHTDQYGFRPKHETSHAVLKALTEIVQSKEEGDSCLGVFIDLKKAFDTVHHKTLLTKLEYLGIEPTWYKSYMTNRSQFTEIGESKSDKQHITTGVPQGSILGPLLFLIYINDLPKSNDLLNILFADDTNFIVRAKTDKELINKTNLGLQKADIWFNSNRLTLHPKKSSFMVFHHKNPQDFNGQIVLQGHRMERNGEQENNPTVKFVGLKIDENITWAEHIKMIRNKCTRGAYIIATMKNQLNTRTKLLIYNALVKSHLQYGITAWGGTKKITELEKVQKKAIRNVTSSKRATHTAPLFAKLRTLKVKDIYKVEIAKLASRCFHQNCPTSLQNLIKRESFNRNTRRATEENTAEIPKIRFTKTSQTHIITMPTTWNTLASDHRNMLNYKQLGKKLTKEEIIRYEQEKCQKTDCYSCK
jgi:hypothetical protein